MAFPVSLIRDKMLYFIFVKMCTKLDIVSEVTSLCAQVTTETDVNDIIFKMSMLKEPAVGLRAEESWVMNNSF